MTNNKVMHEKGQRGVTLYKGICFGSVRGWHMTHLKSLSPYQRLILWGLFCWERREQDGAPQATPSWAQPPSWSVHRQAPSPLSARERPVWWEAAQSASSTLRVSSTQSCLLKRSWQRLDVVSSCPPLDHMFSLWPCSLAGSPRRRGTL